MLTKKKKVAIGFSVLALILILVLFVGHKRRKDQEAIFNGGGNEDPAKADKSRLLGRGHKGLEVRLLQQRLNRDGASPKLSVDGDFGPKTESALMAVKDVSEITLNEYDQARSQASIRSDAMAYRNAI